MFLARIPVSASSFHSSGRSRREKYAVPITSSANATRSHRPRAWLPVVRRCAGGGDGRFLVFRAIGSLRAVADPPISFAVVLLMRRDPTAASPMLSTSEVARLWLAIAL